MAFLLAHFDVHDDEEWKPFFDGDPVDRRGSAEGHRLFQSVDDPSQVFIGVEFSAAAIR